MTSFQLINGDCLEVLKTLPDNSVDSIVTDPPYGISFMGKKWDYDVPTEEVWKECLRVLKPGGHLLSFAGTRTQHRMAVRIEDAGFEIRDMIAWIYASGFPKSLNIGKAVDKLQGNEREELGYREDFVKRVRKNGIESKDYVLAGGWKADPTQVGKITKGTSEWEGWGTALKPALEPITVARKPIEGTVAENVLTHGTGGINIEKSRVPTQEDVSRRERILAGEVVCNGFCDKHESYPRSLADICAFSPQQFLDYLQHISSGLKAYSSSYSNPLRDEASLPGTLGKALLGVPCDYDLLALRVEQCGRDLKGQQDSLGDYPTLSRLCDVHSRLAEGDGQADVPSLADVLADISRLLNQPENNQPNGSNLHLVFASVLFAYSCSKDLIRQHDYTSCKNKSKGARWPSNLLHDGSEEVLECFPNTGSAKKARNGIKGGSIIHDGGCKVDVEGYWPADTGGSAARFFKECKYTNEELWPHQSNNDQPVKSAENPSGLCETSTAPKAVATLEALKGSESHEESPASQDSTGNSENFSQTQNPVSNAESQESTDTTQTTQSSMKSSGSVPLAIDENTKQESPSVVNVQVQGMRLAYHAKASKKDRDEGLEGFEEKNNMRVNAPRENEEEKLSTMTKNHHPTVKPTALMRYLVKLVTPPGGTVLDPFTGSGSTGKACKLEGFDFIGIEREEEYVKIAEARIKAVPDTLL